MKRQPIIRNLNSRIIFGIILLIPFLTNSCITNALLGRGDKLYTGAIIKIHTDTTITGKGKIKSKMKSNAYPLPNSKVAGLPIRMWVYQLMGEPKKPRGLRYFLKYQYGEPPVLLQSVPIDDVNKSMLQLVKANGFLDSKVSSTVKKTWPGTKKYKIIYHAFLKPPYHLNEISTTLTDTAVLRLINTDRQKTLLHPGDQYSLDVLKQERSRINNILKRNGYFYFSDEFIIFRADSTISEKKINLSMDIKNNIDPSYLKPWNVNSVLVRENPTNDTISQDTVSIKGVTFMSARTFKPKVLRRFILFSKDDLLTSTRYNATVKNLSSITSFEFTNMEFQQDTKTNRVDVSIDLVPYKKNNLQFGINMVTKTNNFAGPGAEIRYLNRNLLRGAEQLTIRLNAGIEGWISKNKDVQTIGNYNYEINPSVELNVPRLLLINSSLLSPWYIPYTNFTFEYRLIKQIRFYNMNVFRASYGYRWSETQLKKHFLNIADVSYQKVTQRTAQFIALSGPGSLLSSSFADQFMIGSNYTYQYTPADNDPRKFKTAFTGFLESAGHLIYGLQRLTGVKKASDSSYHFLGSPYSEYVKTSLDLRFYYNISKGNQIATRIFTGVGIPMGNSGILPNLKQFFVGGSSSLRAFQLRSVGPGTYAPDSAVGIPNQTGDIRLEYNIEDRIKIAKQLELALFFDIGNIWLARNDPTRPGSQFNFNTFYRQLASGWGWGIRYLNQFFILRVDVGYPVHRPNPALSKHAVWNLGIGYPF